MHAILYNVASKTKDEKNLENFVLKILVNYTYEMDDLRFRKKFNLGITKDISGKKLSKLEKLQSLVAKCCKIRKI